MQLTFHTLDVFTNRRFGGNPLAVVLGADALSTEQMQTITREFNLSETIFVMKPEDPANTAKVRIFFPGGEMSFAGHPTVGCAVLLAEMKYKAGCSFETEIRLEEGAGLVPVKVSRIGDHPRAQFTAPVVPFAVDLPLPRIDLVAKALSLEPDDISFENHSFRVHQGGPRFFHVPVKTRTALARCVVAEPHWSAMITALGVDNAYVYARGGDSAKTHFRARMFAPTGGIPEDPATGSATALLAAQLLKAEALKDGTHKWQLEQGYEMGRPSDLFLEADVAGGALKAVRVAGQAVKVMQGTLEI
ncbi:MAG TPA: PhzF family phenazine biosynthesis protein [Aestuariivirga sp.]|nr:PhzF family phenazine biosynthesis protein [Aestuariivirga sp.]